jgi:hypothetical protein
MEYMPEKFTHHFLLKAKPANQPNYWDRMGFSKRLLLLFM